MVSIGNSPVLLALCAALLYGIGGPIMKVASGNGATANGLLLMYGVGAGASGVEEPAGSAAPHVNALFQNRPNPFNPETTIPFSLATAGRVRLLIYDVLGRRVRTLVDGSRPAGSHLERWDGRLTGGGRAASGIYLYRIEYPNGRATAKKMALMR